MLFEVSVSTGFLSGDGTGDKGGTGGGGAGEKKDARRVTNMRSEKMAVRTCEVREYMTDEENFDGEFGDCELLSGGERGDIDTVQKATAFETECVAADIRMHTSWAELYHRLAIMKLA